MDPQNHWAAQAPHKANIDTLLNRWLSSPETFQNDDTKFPAINASNRHAENDPTQHFVHGDQVDMHHAWEIKARENDTQACFWSFASTFEKMWWITKTLKQWNKQIKKLSDKQQYKCAKNYFNHK